MPGCPLVTSHLKLVVLSLQNGFKRDVLALFQPCWDPAVLQKNMFEWTIQMAGVALFSRHCIAA